MTYTVGDLIKQTLKITGVLGIGQTPSAEDSNDAMQQLNQMLAQWQRQRWLVYGLTTASLVSTGAQVYMVGPGGDFDMARPNQIESSFMRFNNGAANTVDLPISLINAREDYNEITIKNLGSLPRAVFYDNNPILGDAYFWPIPAAGEYELFITVMEQLQNFTSLTQVITMPPEYVDALQWNLAARLRPMYQLPPEPSVTAFAVKSLEVLRTANAQIARLNMPANLPGIGRGAYNIYSDNN